MSRVITFSAALDLLKAAYEANCIGRLANGDYIVCHENGWFGRDSFELAGELCEDVNGIDTLRKAITDKDIEPPELDAIYAGDMKIEFSTETEYGEPQAWLYIENGESVEITYEKNGLKPSKYFYSIRKHCNEEDFENDVYHKTMGVIEDWNCDNIQALIEIVGFAVKNSIARAEEKDAESEE